MQFGGYKTEDPHPTLPQPLGEGAEIECTILLCLFLPTILTRI
jgi:hypothetical protein